MGKPTICIGENKGADQLRGNREADQRLCFRYSVHFILYLTPKFQASSSFLCLYRLVCVGPVRKPHCWFSHEAAHVIYMHRVLCEMVLVDNFFASLMNFIGFGAAILVRPSAGYEEFS